MFFVETLYDHELKNSTYFELLNFRHFEYVKPICPINELFSEDKYAQCVDCLQIEKTERIHKSKTWNFISNIQRD